jgi:hypothetical protein
LDEAHAEAMQLRAALAAAEDEKREQQQQLQQMRQEQPKQQQLVEQQQQQLQHSLDEAHAEAMQLRAALAAAEDEKEEQKQQMRRMKEHLGGVEEQLLQLQGNVQQEKDRNSNRNRLEDGKEAVSFRDKVRNAHRIVSCNSKKSISILILCFLKDRDRDLWSEELRRFEDEGAAMDADRAGKTPFTQVHPNFGVRDKTYCTPQLCRFMTY